MANEIERKQPQQGEVADPEVGGRGQGDDLRGIADEEGEFEETEDLDEEEEDESIR